MMKWVSIMLLFVYLLSACQSKRETAEGLTTCTEPRAQICTMIYDPVCGVDKAGQSKTYASGCSACSQGEVVAYREGECANSFMKI